MEERGRPTVMDAEMIRKLEDAFLQGLSDREACLSSGIGTSTLYDYCKANPDFSERKELLKEQVKLKAKLNISRAINNGDRQLSQWYLERRDKEFKPKSDMTSDDKPIFLPSEILEKNNLHDPSRSTEADSEGQSQVQSS